MKINKNSITALVFLALLFIQTTVVAKPNSKQSNIIAEFSFPKDEGSILLPVTLAGKKYLFLLDTGATHNIYDISLKKDLGLSLGKTNIMTSSSMMNVSIFESPHAKLGKLNFKTTESVVCSDFRQLREAIGQPIYGIVGISFLKKYTLKIDFDSNKVIFYKTLKKVDVVGYSPVLFKLKLGLRGVPWVQVSIPGGKVWSMIDTGDNSNGSLAKIIFNSLAKNSKIGHLNSSLFLSLNEVTTNREGLLSSFAVGSLDASSLLLNSSLHNKVGLNYLSRYTVFFDYPNRMLYLKKRKSYRKDILCKTGLSLIRKKGETIVYLVKKSSPASKVGFKKDDILLSVDDKKSSDFTLYMLHRYLKKPGLIIEVKISRKGKIMKLQLKPEVY